MASLATLPVAFSLAFSLVAIGRGTLQLAYHMRISVWHFGQGGGSLFGNSGNSSSSGGGLFSGSTGGATGGLFAGLPESSSGGIFGGGSIATTGSSLFGPMLTSSRGRFDAF